MKRFLWLMPSFFLIMTTVYAIVGDTNKAILFGILAVTFSFWGNRE